MAFSKTEQVIYDLVKQKVAENGAYIYDVEYAKESGFWFLRIYADKDGGITMDDCENITRAINPLLDKADIIKHNYYLEVSSPGIERKLKTKEHFDAYIGKMIEVGLFSPIDGRKNIVGALISFENDTVKVEENGSIYEIPFEKVAYAKLKADWDNM